MTSHHDPAIEKLAALRAGGTLELFKNREVATARGEGPSSLVTVLQ